MISWGRRLVFALQVMTRFPLSAQLKVTENDFPRMAMFFPIVGLCVGLFSAIIALAVNWVTNSDLISACTAVICSTLITGAFHLDGWSDSFDAIGAGRNREKMLQAMKDSRIGVRGGIALIIDLMLKIALTFIILSTAQNYLSEDMPVVVRFLSSIEIHTYETGVFQKAWTVIIAAHVLSRTAIAAGGAIAHSARKDGSGRLFVERMNGWDLLRALLLCIPITYLLLGAVLTIILVCLMVLIGFLVAGGVQSRLGGITGDTLGAINESAELACLFAIVLIRYTF